MWSFNNQNFKLYLNLNLLPSFRLDSFQVGYLLWEGYMDGFSSSFFWSAVCPTLTSCPSVTGVCGREERKRDKKVLTGTPSAVSWPCLSGPADVWYMTRLMEYIGGFLRSSYVGTSYHMPYMWFTILCDLLWSSLKLLGILSLFCCWDPYILWQTQDNPRSFSHGKFSLIFWLEQLRNFRPRPSSSGSLGFIIREVGLCTL